MVEGITVVVAVAVVLVTVLETNDQNANYSREQTLLRAVRRVTHVEVWRETTARLVVYEAEVVVLVSVAECITVAVTGARPRYSEQKAATRTVEFCLLTSVRSVDMAA